ncbi:uncharacterized protein LOC131699533, partial [Acipenser ruthenus]|uniref:uncharacterized protein LOC131699533 n=1 Tax=Acipenser ruthenus TaxID=7906 RepID=UPI0027419491
TWQCLEVGIMAGCTISPLAFTMAMEVIIRASKWVVGGERLASGMRLPPIRAYMDDMTTMTTTVACTNRLLGKLTNNIEWARMQFKPTKSRSISIIKGKVVDKTFFINGEAIPTVSEKPVKSLGRWYDGDLKDTVRVGEVRQQAVEGLKSIDSCALPGKLKLWCFQFGLLPRLLWPLTVYEVSLTTVEKLEALISSYIRKWLGVPRCLSRVGLYGKGILQLPVSALTEEFKCAKVRLEMTLVESRDKCVREAAPVLKTGRKWAAKKAVEDAKAALRIGDIMGQVQHGRGGLGFSSTPPTWHKAAPAQRRKMVVNEVQKQEERMRCIKAISQAKQGEWMRWESVEQRKIGWQDLWSMEQSRISFLIRSTYDVLPSPQNLNLWVGEDPSCPLCSSPATLRHILTGCKVALSQGRFTWRHDQVLRCLALALEDKRNMTNKLPPVPSLQNGRGQTSSVIRYPDEVTSAKAKKLYKNKLMKESPETLIADCSLAGDKRTKTNLLFYTEHPTAWHTTLCTAHNPRTLPLTPRLPSTVQHLKECLSLLEVEFAEFKEFTLTTLTENDLVQQIRDEVRQPAGFLL